MSDTIHITILEDGTIKTETDAVSAPNHLNAEQFLRSVQQLAGGMPQKKMKHSSVFTTQHQKNELFGNH